LIVAAALAAPAQPDCRDVSFSKALALARTRQMTCVERNRELNVWSLRRTVTDRRGASPATYTDTSACPAVLPILQAVESLELPRPNLHGFGDELEVITMDGAEYTLTTSAPYGGNDSDLTVRSNVGTPLARWIDAALTALEPCWRTAI
jgi:hypothetical protein